mmetsp:Transcript_137041/g.382107  ORF Transcript_137041/g.382107 Transcript_137041/m.382107 type:complete len:218 (+) Transcript_137041:1387-2040(+)
MSPTSPANFVPFSSTTAASTAASSLAFVKLPVTPTNSAFTPSVRDTEASRRSPLFKLSAEARRAPSLLPSELMNPSSVTASSSSVIVQTNFTTSTSVSFFVFGSSCIMLAVTTMFELRPSPAPLSSTSPDKSLVVGSWYAVTLPSNEIAPALSIKDPLASMICGSCSSSSVACQTSHGRALPKSKSMAATTRSWALSLESVTETVRSIFMLGISGQT